MPRIGLGGSQWFDYEYDSTNDALVISRNAEANGSVVIRNQDLSVEGSISGTTINATTLAAAAVTCSATITGTSYTAGAFAGFTGTCPAANNLMVQGGIIVATS